MPFAYDLTGTLLDRRYRITGLLGKGGMGFVYAAQHVGLEQRVAIKVLSPRFADEERYRERFIREARSASKIKHRNVVRITDFGETPDGSVYFAMEFLEGHDLGAELKKVGPMKWPRARYVLLQAVGALRAAHAKDIIHRDIKPANCFLTADKDEGVVDFVKLLDFGIAKVGSESHAEAQGKGLTGTGEVFGTAAYMSPEQAAGGELDARSDVYSLGVMAYEMLTGQVPFSGINSIHVITRHLNDSPQPLRELDPEIPERVEALVLRCLAKQPAERFESMGALEGELRAIPESAGPQPRRRTQFWGSAAAGRGGRPGFAKSGTLGNGVPQKRDQEKTQPRGSSASFEPSADDPTVVNRDRASVVGSARVHKRTVVPDRAGPRVEPFAATVSVSPPGGRERGDAGRNDPAGAGPAEPPGRRTVVDTNPPPVRTVVDTNPPPVRSMAAAPPGEYVGDTSSPSVPRISGTAPPPGNTESQTGPTAWPPPTSSTGPMERREDSSADTSPHAFETTQTLFSIPLLAVLGLLVIVVSGGSVFVTMAFMSDDETVQGPGDNEGEQPPEEPPRRPGIDPESSVDADETPTVIEASSVAGSEPEPESLPPAEAPSEIEGEGGAEEDEIILEDDEPILEPEGGAMAPTESTPLPTVPKTARHETDACKRTRAAAREGLQHRKWGAVLEQVRATKCWSRGEQPDRRWMHAKALLELGRFDECVAVGRRAKEAKTVNIVDICRRKIG